MQKIIVDTNVIVSALIQRSYPYLIMNHLFIDHKVEICISDELMKEYYDVLNRKKFSKYPDFVSGATAILTDIENKSAGYLPTVKLQILSDPDDDKLLELAHASKAHFFDNGKQ